MDDFQRGRQQALEEFARLLESDEDFCRDLADEYPLHESKHGWRLQAATIRRAIVLLGHLAGGTAATAELWLRREQGDAQLEQARAVLRLQIPPGTVKPSAEGNWLSHGSEIPQ